jgi:hypothetical protein
VADDDSIRGKNLLRNRGAALRLYGSFGQVGLTEMASHKNNRFITDFSLKLRM